MEKYESGIKTLAFPPERVYARLSDLTSFEAIKSNVDSPQFEQIIRSQIPEGKTFHQDKFDQMRNTIRQMEFTQDTVSGNAGPLGNVTLRIIEREENRLIKAVIDGAPVESCLWIQILPSSDGGSRMKVTIGAELNFFFRKMVGSKLQQAVDGVAQMLSSIPY